MKNIFKILAVVLPVMLSLASCKKDTSVAISVDPDSKSVVIRAGKPLNFKYSVFSGTGSAEVKVTVSENIALTQIPGSDGMSGTLILVLKEEHENSYMEISANNGVNSDTYKIELEMETVAFDGPTKVTVPEKAGDFSLGIKTNVDYEVTISPESATEWLSAVPVTKAVEHKDVMMHVTANEDVTRHAKVTVKSKTSSIYVEFDVAQQGILKNLLTTYGSREVISPNLLGNNPAGTIFWGDGLTLKWQKDAQHIYTDNKTIHVAELHTNVSNVEYSTLMGVRKISFTDLQ